MANKCKSDMFYYSLKYKDQLTTGSVLTIIKDENNIF